MRQHQTKQTSISTSTTTTTAAATVTATVPPTAQAQRRRRLVDEGWERELRQKGLEMRTHLEPF
jgi:hypothetical protein